MEGLYKILWDVSTYLFSRFVCLDKCLIINSMLIWTHHARRRLTERGFTKDMVQKTFSHPDTSFAGREKGTTEYHKRFGSSLVTVIVKQNEQQEWIIVSTWIDPPLPGTTDAKKKKGYLAYQRAGFWGKIWITVKRQLGMSW
jgi:hypothetical protein